MNETYNRETCERGSELISVLYGEANEQETLNFQKHLQVCATCRAEMGSFGQLRESIEGWKLEALSGFATPQFAMPTEFQRRKSAFAAFREFFDLSPLWLKGATAFAGILFVLFAIIAFGKFSRNEPVITAVQPGAVYSEEQKNAIVQKALDDQKAELLASLQPKSEEAKQSIPSAQPRRGTGSTTSFAKGRRPLSRWEREQLATDLRLLQSDDDGLQLLSDRINPPED